MIPIETFLTEKGTSKVWFNNFNLKKKKKKPRKTIF